MVVLMPYRQPGAHVIRAARQVSPSVDLPGAAPLSEADPLKAEPPHPCLQDRRTNVVPRPRFDLATTTLSAPSTRPAGLKKPVEARSLILSITPVRRFVPALPRSCQRLLVSDPGWLGLGSLTIAEAVPSRILLSCPHLQAHGSVTSACDSASSVALAGPL